MAVTWRHRTALIHQWNRINLALTARVLTFMYGPGFPQLKIRMCSFINLVVNTDSILEYAQANL